MMRKTFGERIRELRAGLDLSLSELGQRVKKTPPFLSDIELGRRFPSEEFLLELARELKTTVDDLKSYDTRAPVDELKRLAMDNPAFGIALRKLVDKQISAEDLMKLAEKKADRKEK